MSYTAEDADRAAKNPAALREDNPPLLRFVNEAVENRPESERQGKYVRAPVVKVYMRAAGDNKTEVPAIVKGWKLISEPMTHDDDGNLIPEEERWEYKQNGNSEFQRILKTRQKLAPATPWFDQLNEKRRNGLITQRYYDYCKEAFARWEKNGEVPENGTPITEWKQISYKEQINLQNIGIRTVEAAAEMTEEAITSYGMGGREVKRKAIAYLEADSGVEKAAAKIASLEAELERQRVAEVERTNAFEQKMAELEARMTTSRKKA